jgi:hypothetical protein
MARQCGITGQAPREGEEQMLIRLAPEDCAGELGRDGLPLTPGLYQVNRETYEKFRPRVAARLMKTQAIGDDGRPVWDAEALANGQLKPVMFIEHESQAHGAMVM